VEDGSLPSRSRRSSPYLAYARTRISFPVAEHLAESTGLPYGWPEVCDPDHCDWYIQRKLRDYRQCCDAKEGEKDGEYESPLLSSENNREIEDDNTTAPLLAHKL